MPINIPIPNNVDQHRPLSQLLKEMLRRAIDGSLNPIQINVQINVTSNDIVVVTAGKGLVVTTPNGLHTYRINVANDGALQSTLLT